MRRDEVKAYMIKIAKKRLHKETEKAYMFFTSGYGGVPVFIPKSQILLKDFDDPEWIRLKITKFAFKNIALDLGRVSEHQIKITESYI